MKRLVSYLGFTTVIVVAMLASLLITGCAPKRAPAPAPPPTPAPSPAPAPPPAPQLPKEITFTTALEGTVYYTLTVGMADIINKNTPMKCIVQPIGFIMQWGPSMEKGDVHLSMQSTSGSYAYHYGALWWKDKPSYLWLQQLTSGNEGKYAFHVRADSKIKTIPDLVGKKLYCNLPAVPMIMAFVDGVFEYYGIKHEDVQELVVTDWAEAVQEVIDRRADCVITTVGAAYPKIKQAGGCRILPVSKEAAEHTSKKYPFYSYSIAPVGYLGLTEDALVLTDPVILLTHKAVPAEVTYTVLKALYDNYDKFAPVHAEAKDWTLDRAARNQCIPYHSGAIKYLKEKGLWTPKLEQFQKDVLAKDLEVKK